jgi:hypothetical protein
MRGSASQEDIMLRELLGVAAAAFFAVLVWATVVSNPASLSAFVLDWMLLVGFAGGVAYLALRVLGRATRRRNG